MENPENQHRSKTNKGVFYTVLGVILPFILSFLAITLLGKYDRILEFLDQGQFLLFAAGLFTTSIFLFGENEKSIKRNYDRFFNASAIWLLIISSALYAMIYLVYILNNPEIQLNLWFIRVISFMLFIIAVISVYRSIFIDFLKMYPEVDVKKESKKGVDDILNQI